MSCRGPDPLQSGVLGSVSKPTIKTPEAAFKEAQHRALFRPVREEHSRVSPPDFEPATTEAQHRALFRPVCEARCRVSPPNFEPVSKEAQHRALSRPVCKARSRSSAHFRAHFPRFRPVCLSLVSRSSSDRSAASLTFGGRAKPKPTFGPSTPSDRDTASIDGRKPKNQSVGPIQLRAHLRAHIAQFRPVCRSLASNSSGQSIPNPWIPTTFSHPKLEVSRV
jgi:hypothetical protein